MGYPISRHTASSYLYSTKARRISSFLLLSFSSDCLPRPSFFFNQNIALTVRTIATIGNYDYMQVCPSFLHSPSSNIVDAFASSLARSHPRSFPSSTSIFESSPVYFSSHRATSSMRTARSKPSFKPPGELKSSPKKIILSMLADAAFTSLSRSFPFSYIQAAHYAHNGDYGYKIHDGEAYHLLTSSVST